MLSLRDAVLLHRLPPRFGDDGPARVVGMSPITAKMLTHEQRLEVHEMTVHRTRRTQVETSLLLRLRAAPGLQKRGRSGGDNAR